MSEKDLKKQIWALEAHANSASVLAKATTPHELIVGVCEGITNQFPYVLAWVGLISENNKKNIDITGASGNVRAYLDGIKVSWDECSPSGNGPAGKAIRFGKSQLMVDSELDEDFAPWRSRANQWGIRSALAIPIKTSGKVLGVLMVYASVSNAFLPPEIKLFESLAEEVGYGLVALNNKESLEQERVQREQAQQKLIDSLELTIAAMATTMEMRDPYTAGHQRHVAEISKAIAKEMGWDDHRILGLKMAALVHDLGKVSIPAELLTKPGKLTPIEYSLMKEHVNNGYLILKDIPFDWPIADIVRQHHERMDGSGYPNGLSGDEILPEARILAVADIIESMSSHRPYRPALGLDKAIEEITLRSGKDLDAEVVNAALNLNNRKQLEVANLTA